MKNEKVGNVPGNVLGMIADLAHKLQHGSISPEELAMFLKRQNPLEAVGSIKDWEKFYLDVFGIEEDFSNLKIPDKKAEFDRLIIIAQGMTSQRLFDKCKELFPSWKWTDKNLNETVNSERTSKDGAYAVWFRNQVEADEDLKNLSADHLKERSIPGITLEERLLFELKYFKETGKHLDIENITLCSGSRCSGACVPSVCWFRGELGVRWYGPDDRDAPLRSRRAVL